MPPEFVEIAEVNGVRVYGGPCRDAEEPGVVLVSLNGSPRGVVEASIEDFSIEPVADLAGAVEAALRLAKRHGKIGFCCGGGCGRTSTAYALFMMANGVPLEEALGRFYERRGCGPEVVEQRFLLSVFELIRRHMGSGAVLEALDSLRRSGHFKTTYTLRDAEDERVEANLTSRSGSITYRVKGTGARVDPEYAGELGDLVKREVVKGLEELAREDMARIKEAVGDPKHPIALLIDILQSKPEAREELYRLLHR